MLSFELTQVESKYSRVLPNLSSSRLQLFTRGFWRNVFRGVELVFILIYADIVRSLVLDPRILGSFLYIKFMKNVYA